MKPPAKPGRHYLLTPDARRDAAARDSAVEAAAEAYAYAAALGFLESRFAKAKSRLGRALARSGAAEAAARETARQLAGLFQEARAEAAAGRLGRRTSPAPSTPPDDSLAEAKAAARTLAAGKLAAALVALEVADYRLADFPGPVFAKATADALEALDALPPDTAKAEAEA